MCTDRRDFLRLSAGVAGVTLLGRTLAYADTETLEPAPQQTQPEAIRRLRRMTDNVVPINTTKPPTPTPDQMFNLIFKRWKDNKVNAREVCSAVIDIADRGNWNWKDPDGRMHTAREKALPFFQGFCVPNENEVYRADLSESQCRLFDFICESFFRWYERQEAAGYPGFKKQE